MLKLKGNKLFHNLKIMWIYMFSTKKVLGSGEKEWWFPCHPNNKKNHWVIVWCCGCHGLHLHYAHVGSSPWDHQVCSKLQYFCLWLCGSYEYVLCIFLFTLLWSKEEVHWFVIQKKYWSCGLYSLQMPFNKDLCYVCTW